MDAPRTTNIFRWCNLPEIGRCHVGDPDHPDNVIWVTNVQDFDRLRQQDLNVVLQEQTAATGGNESVTDLSTLYQRLGTGVRYINIETPGSPRNPATQEQNLNYILRVLRHLGLACCEPPEPELPQPLPYREATHLLECIRIMGEENAPFCRRQILEEMQSSPEGGL